MYGPSAWPMAEQVRSIYGGTREVHEQAGEGPWVKDDGGNSKDIPDPVTLLHQVPG
jgi:hypothetical protein